MKMEGGVGGKEEDAAADEHAQQQMAELKAEIRIKDALIQSLQAQLARYGAAHASARSLSPAPAAKAVAKNTFVAAAAVVPGDMFFFSPRGEHKYSGVKLSSDRLTVTRAHNDYAAYAWARSERGAAPGCGVVRWALQLQLDDDDCDDEAREHAFKVGVCSDYFSGYAEHDPELCHYFENQDNGTEPFAAGDVVTLELHRAPGVENVDVLRVRVAGKKPQSRRLKRVPSDCMLYPIVCMSNEYQSYTMVQVPPQ